MLISEALVLSQNSLKQKGVNSHRIDALLLLGHALRMSKEQIIFNPNFELSPTQEIEFLELLKRRENREPISHILGRREFYGLDFIVSGDVLDPRPDSESLIEVILEIFPEKNYPLEVLELGVGSACLLTTVLKYFPKASGTGVDISDKALAIAQKNIDLLEVKARTNLIKSNWFSNLDSGKYLRKFDLIISNPPYIKTSDILLLQEEVKNFEPHLALDGGITGLDCYEAIAKDVKNFLKDKGFLILEIGDNQEKDVTKIFNLAGLNLIEEKKDLSGTVRGLLFQKNENI